MSVDVDIVTGLPLDTQAKERELAENLLDKEAQASDLMNELTAPAGQQLIAEVEKLLTVRIEFLMRQDPQCFTCLTLLRTLGSKVNYAPAIARDEINRMLQYRAAR